MLLELYSDLHREFFRVRNAPFHYVEAPRASLYKVLERDMFSSFRHLCTTEHTHHPLDDARGHAEVLLRMKAEFGLHIRLQ